MHFQERFGCSSIYLLINLFVYLLTFSGGGGGGVVHFFFLVFIINYKYQQFETLTSLILNSFDLHTHTSVSLDQDSPTNSKALKHTDHINRLEIW